MNRVIQFRSWNRHTKTMIANPQCNAGWLNDMLNNSYGDNTGSDMMQWTGAIDRHNIKVFEGDIVKVLDRDWPSQLSSHPELNHEQYIDSITSICEVIWDKGSFWLEQKIGMGYYSPEVFHSRGRDIFEVIGNVFENPELLKGKQ